MNPLHEAADKYAQAIKAETAARKQLEAASGFSRLARAAYEEAENKTWVAQNEFIKLAGDQVEG